MYFHSQYDLAISSLSRFVPFSEVSSGVLSGMGIYQDFNFRYSLGVGWIGATDKLMEGVWMFSDGTDYDRSIVPVQESGSGSGSSPGPEAEWEDCAYADFVDGKVYDNRCEAMYPINGHVCKTGVFQGKIPSHKFFFQ